MTADELPRESTTSEPEKLPFLVRLALYLVDRRQWRREKKARRSRDQHEVTSNAVTQPQTVTPPRAVRT
jgi:hypothetical protein